MRSTRVFLTWGGAGCAEPSTSEVALSPSASEMSTREVRARRCAGACEGRKFEPRGPRRGDGATPARDALAREEDAGNA